MDREGERAEAGVGADVAGRLLAADVLLARRQRQHEAALAVGIDGLAGEAARASGARISRASRTGRHRGRRNSARCRSTGPRRRRCRRPSRPATRQAPSDTASVTTAISSAPLAWRLRRSGVRSRRWPKKSGFCTTTQLVSSSIAAENVFGQHGGLHAIDLVAGEARQRRADLGVMRMQAAGEHRLLAPRDAMRHQHRLAAGGRAVVHRGVGDLHAGQQRDLGLELEQHLQRALRDLRLIGRVAGQELAALDQMIDGRRDVMAIGAGAEEERDRAGGDVLRGERGRARARRRARSLACGIGSRSSSRLRAGMSANSASMSGDADAGEHQPPVVGVERQIAHQSRSSSDIRRRPRRPSGRRVRVGSASFSLNNQPRPCASSLTRLGASPSLVVDVDDLAGGRGEHVARRLDAFDHRRGLALLELRADLRQIDEHDVAELLLRMFADADGGDIAAASMYSWSWVKRMATLRSA